MAGYECGICEGERPVEWLFTNLPTGTTVACCREDLPMALIGSLAEVLGTDTGRLYESIRKFAEREQARAAKGGPQPAPEPPPAPAGRRQQPSSDAGGQADDDGTGAGQAAGAGGDAT